MKLTPVILLLFFVDVARAFKIAVPYELTFLASFCDDRIVAPDDENRIQLLQYILEDQKDMGEKCLRQLIVASAKEKSNYKVETAKKLEDGTLPLVNDEGEVSYIKFHHAVDWLNTHGYNKQHEKIISSVADGKGAIDGRIYLNPITDKDIGEKLTEKKKISTRLYTQAMYSTKAISQKVLTNVDSIGNDELEMLGNAVKSIATSRGNLLLSDYKKVYSAMTSDKIKIEMMKEDVVVTQDQVESWIKAITGSDNPSKPSVDYDSLADAIENHKVSSIKYKSTKENIMQVGIEDPAEGSIGHLIPIEYAVKGFNLFKTCF